MRASTLQFALVLALLGSLSTVRGRGVLPNRADVSCDADTLGACPKGVKSVTDHLATDFDGAILPILPRAGGSGGHDGGGGHDVEGGHDDGSGDGSSDPGGATGAGDGGSSGDRGDGSLGGDGGPKKNPWDANDGSSSPDSTASKGSQSTSDDQFPQGSANQPVVDIVSKGYGSIADMTNPSLILVHVTTPLVDGPLDTLELDITLDSIGVKWAINDLDTIAENPSKVPLRSILADSWRVYAGLSGKQMSDLKSVNYQVVIKEDMEKAFPLAYKAAGQEFVAGQRTPLTVTADTFKGIAYNILMDTTFGGGAKKMIAETAGLEDRTIYSIDLFPTDPPKNTIDVRFNF